MSPLEVARLHTRHHAHTGVVDRTASPLLNGVIPVYITRPDFLEHLKHPPIHSFYCRCLGYIRKRTATPYIGGGTQPLSNTSRCMRITLWIFHTGAPPPEEHDPPASCTTCAITGPLCSNSFRKSHPPGYRAAAGFGPGCLKCDRHATGMQDPTLGENLISYQLMMCLTLQERH